jgi:hypothetical protein
MIITLTRSSYTITDMAISNVRYSRPLHYLLVSVIIWLLFAPHTEILENSYVWLRVAIAIITIAGGVILADLVNEMIDQTIQLILKKREVRINAK